MSKKATDYFNSLEQIFETNRIEADAAPMEKYMRNQFQFYGIKSPLRKELLRAFWKMNAYLEGEDLKAYVRLAWAAPQREHQYTAMETIGKKLKHLDTSFIPFFEELILKKSWWDTVDWLAPNGMGKLFLKFPDLMLRNTNRWIVSDNIWLQRSAILFQLKYKEKTDFDLLTRYILERADSKEFFVQKASGWALREYSKRAADEVVGFIQKNDLAPLTKKEGLKWLKNRNLL